MHSPVRSRGFTLVELLVGTVVGSIVLLAISMTFISQAQQYQAHASRRAVQASARQSMAFMERRVRLAGYGVHPDRAVLAYDSYDVESDSAVAGHPDALVVHSRDPLFRRVVLDADTAQINLPAGSGISEPMQQGQILLLLCPLASDYAFVTVAADLPAGTTTIPLDQSDPATAPNSPTAAPGGLFREHALLNRPCFDSSTVVRINRSAFYVAMFDNDGNPATQGSTPFLMMHQGLDLDASGTIDAEDSVPVAEGIEQFQVAYILNANTPTGLPLIRGVNEVPMMPPAYYGEQWQRIDADLNSYNAANAASNQVRYWFFDGRITATHDFRRRDHPANIRQIRLSVVARSTVSDQQITGDNLLTPAQGTALADGTIPWRQLENVGMPVPQFAPAGGGYYRVILRESLTPKNLLMNAQFPPVSFVSATAPGGG
jgi:type IV pilus assembly protein PilW